MLNYRRSPCGLFDGKAGKSLICFLREGYSRILEDVLSEDVRRELIVKYSVFNHSDRVNRLLTCY